MQWLVNPIGDFLIWALSFLEPLENLPNYLFIVLGFVLFAYWMSIQSKFNKDAEGNPDQLK